MSTLPRQTWRETIRECWLAWLVQIVFLALLVYALMQIEWFQ